MNIITSQGSISSDTSVIIFHFENDDELNDFITKLATSPVRTSGNRVLTISPQNVEMTPLQNSILNIIESLDGFGTKNDKEHQAIVDNAIDGLNDLIGNK